MVSFRARLQPIRGGGHFVLVADEDAARAGVRFRDRVRGTVDGAPYRASLARYSDGFHVGVTSEVMRAAGARTRALVTVTLEPDPDPLPGDVMPDEMAAAIARSKRARAGWDALPPAHKREHVKFVIEAKKPETRLRRIVKTLAALEAHGDAAAAKAAPRATAKKPLRRARSGHPGGR